MDVVGLGRLLCRLAFFGGVIAVLIGSLTPATEMPDIGVSDKIQHFGAYAALAFTAALGWSRGPMFGVMIAGVVVAGPAIEVLQMIVPGRSASWGDVVADLVGVAIGLALARVTQPILARA